MSISPAPAPDFGYAAPPGRKRVLWKWSLAVSAIVLLLVLWQCGSAMWQGRKLSLAAVEHFHDQLNHQRYEEISSEADEAFVNPENHQELLDLLAAVHRKLGNAVAETLNRINVNATTNGTFITTVYTTSFNEDLVVETFVWKKHGSQIKLYGYNINSKVLVMK